MKKIFSTNKGIASAAIFMSGSGTNAENLLLSLKDCEKPSWEASVIVTDAPDKSRAGEIAEKEGLPLVSLDIRKFYQSYGEKTISIKTEKGRVIREKWTDKLRELIAPFNIDFGIFAGFVPLTNITDTLPCLNVHPGDLTVKNANGERILVGLHTIPVERAILEEHNFLRSSVILAQPYTGSGGNMDSGLILGISPQVPVNLYGTKLEEFKRCFYNRPAKRPAGGFKDILEEIAGKNLEQLKVDGDWVVFPPAVADFASEKFAYDEAGVLYYFENGEHIKIKTVEYGSNGEKKLIKY